MTVQEKTQAALQVVLAVADAIKEAKEIPSGHLYAALVGKLSLQQYESIIQTLKNAGLVVEKNHLLIWNAEGTR